ncbi:MAG: hydroxyacylglutathione hydrolase [Kordiimonadales bacterium]|nr:MAG: hydroxyacylglutathione hydrolase [Kordiimonadales bacterium]
MLEIVQIPVLQDNYLYLIYEPKSGQTAIVDPALEEPVIAEVEKRGWALTHIINTHHHWDHVGANEALKERFGLTIIGPKADKDRIPGIDICVDEGDQITLGDAVADVYFVPGHTRGHIAYHFAEADALFCGDTIFSMGCGRLFEGTPAQMWHSISKLAALPDETLIYCAHEYTTANGNFALSIEPKNAALVARMADVAALRANGKPTVPTTLGLEKKTNPFLRPMSAEIQHTIGLAGADLTDVFAEVRHRKDNF